MSHKLTYFELLPLDTLQNVTRFLSTEPCHEEWRKHIGTETLNLLFNANSPLLGAAEDAVGRKLCVYDDQSDIDLVTQMISVAGARFNTLELEGPSFRNWQRVRSLVARECVGLKALTLNLAGWNSQLVRIFEEHGASVESVRLRLFPVTSTEMRDVMRAMAAHCTSLRSVALHVQHLRETDVLWQRRGSTLRSLSVQPFPSTYLPTLLEQLGLHCSRLSSVRISTFFGKPGLMAAVARLLVSLGERLHYAFLGDMSPAMCAQVAAACTNARFAVRDSPRTALQMACLGARLAEVEVTSARAQELDDAPLASATLCNLEAVAFNCKAVGGDLLRAVFAGEKPRLRNMRLSYVSYLPARILDVLALTATQMRRLELSEVNLELGLFRVFAAANRRLEHVSIEGFNGSSEDNAAVVIDVMDSFNGCTYLSSLEIGPIGPRYQQEDEALKYLYDSGIATACLPLKRRGAHLKIRGIVV